MGMNDLGLHSDDCDHCTGNRGHCDKDQARRNCYRKYRT